MNNCYAKTIWVWALWIPRNQLTNVSFLLFYLANLNFLILFISAHFYFRSVLPTWKDPKCYWFISSFDTLFCDVSQGHFMLYIYD